MNAPLRRSSRLASKKPTMSMATKKSLPKMDTPVRRSYRLIIKESREGRWLRNRWAWWVRFGAPTPASRSPRLSENRVKKYKEWFKSKMMDLPKGFRFPESISLLFSTVTSDLNSLYASRYNYETRGDMSYDAVNEMIYKLFLTNLKILRIIDLYNNYANSSERLFTFTEHQKLDEIHPKFCEVIENRQQIIEDMRQFIVNNRIGGIYYMNFSNCSNN
jgi:hypothetical protein